jgi:hypothetical protein
MTAERTACRSTSAGNSNEDIGIDMRMELKLSAENKRYAD